MFNFAFILIKNAVFHRFSNVILRVFVMNIYKCLNYGKKKHIYTSLFSGFVGCFQFILREHLYLNLKWWTNSYFIQVMIKNHENLVSAVMHSM